MTTNRPSVAGLPRLLPIDYHPAMIAGERCKLRYRVADRSDPYATHWQAYHNKGWRRVYIQARSPHLYIYRAAHERTPITIRRRVFV